MNKLINLFLLVVMSFSIAHGVVLDTHSEESHCSAGEHVVEFFVPVEHHDEHVPDNATCDNTCETHCMLHVSFLLPEHFSLFEINTEVMTLELLLTSSPTDYKKNTFRPPIA